VPALWTRTPLHTRREAINDQAYFKTTIDKIRGQRHWLTHALRKLGFDVLESQANFVWATITRPAARTLYNRLKESGILVRYFDKQGLRNALRVTVGRPAENRKLIMALKRIIVEGR
jgi:histidinol-phosphate aminotransferase